MHAQLEIRKNDFPKQLATGKRKSLQPSTFLKSNPSTQSALGNMLVQQLFGSGTLQTNLGSTSQVTNDLDDDVSGGGVGAKPIHMDVEAIDGGVDKGLALEGEEFGRTDTFLSTPFTVTEHPDKFLVNGSFEFRQDWDVREDFQSGHNLCTFSA